MVPVNHLLLAIGFGVVLGNTVGVPSWVEPGVEQYDVVLKAGIVLMGAHLVFYEILDAGPRILLLVLGVLIFAVVSVEVVSNSLFGIDDKLSSLLSSGTAVCGVSAIVATAGGIDADEEQIPYAVGTVLVFDALTLVDYPVAASLLGLGEKPFGIWAGVSMFSTRPVTAAGFAHSEVLGTWATLTKLTRNFFLGASSYSTRSTMHNPTPPAASGRFLPGSGRTFQSSSSGSSLSSRSPASRCYRSPN